MNIMEVNLGAPSTSSGLRLFLQKKIAASLAICAVISFAGCARAQPANPISLAALPINAEQRSSVRAIHDVATAAGEKAEPLDFPDGSRVLVLRTGGRLLALSHGDQPTVLWNNPVFASAERVRTYFSDTKHWRNIGGDRTWLAPEWNLFIADPAHIGETYTPPPEIDRGHFSIDVAGGQLSAKTEFSIKHFRPDLHVDGTIRKTWTPAVNPLSGEGAGITYAGYTQRTTLELRSVKGDNRRSDGSPVMLGLWNLLQLPHGGHLMIPTYSRAAPRVVFGDVTPSDLFVTDRTVDYFMHAAGSEKITLLATTLTGRAGYLYRNGPERYTLIIRNFFVDPSAAYADPLWAEPDGLRYCVQACSSSEGDERFSELEYHAPAVIATTGAASADVSTVWSFSGTSAQIRLVASRLLGIELAP
jgi:hypothetical protein